LRANAADSKRGPIVAPVCWSAGRFAGAPWAASWEFARPTSQYRRSSGYPWKYAPQPLLIEVCDRRGHRSEFTRFIGPIQQLKWSGARSRFISNAASIDWPAARQSLARNAQKPRNVYNVSQPDSSTSKAFARYPSVMAARCRHPMEGVSMRILVFSAHRSLLHRSYRCRCNWRCYAAVSGCALGAEAQPDDIIKQPSLLRQKLAGNCTTTCQWIGRQQFCNTHCF
jgi:hypothetical protein